MSKDDLMRYLILALLLIFSSFPMSESHAQKKPKRRAITKQQSSKAKTTKRRVRRAKPQRTKRIRSRRARVKQRKRVRPVQRRVVKRTKPPVKKKKKLKPKPKRQLTPLQREFLRMQMGILLSDPEMGPIYRQIITPRKSKR